MLCLLLLLTFRFDFFASFGCEPRITNGHREQMRSKQILYKAGIFDHRSAHLAEQELAAGSLCQDYKSQLGKAQREMKPGVDGL